MKEPKPYADLVTQAEAATSAIKDPELRRVAFERVLDDLLSGGGSGQKVGSPALKQVESSTRTGAKSKKTSGPKGCVRRLLDDGFFKNPKTIAEVKAQLANLGHHIALTSLSGPLQQLCQERVLRRQKAKSGGKAKKPTFYYSVW
jgi:hypothetical protein